MASSVQRLYKQFQPNHYDLSLTISEDKKSFSGKVTVKGRKTTRPSKRITLHQKDLEINNATITAIDKKGARQDKPLARISNHAGFDEVRLHASEDIYPGEYELTITFTGNITKNMDGIYPCFFKEDGVEKELIATQFESHHAREAFPCIDEPEAKATFQLTLGHAASELPLSNTEILSTKSTGHRAETLFDVTPVMSTYLLAFVVGELKIKETTSKNGVLIRTVATRDQIKNSEFALDVASKCMDYYEDYYDIPFPLKKCDFVALPDFASGAMENWGLITFREQTLLCDEKTTSLGTKQYVALVVAHELTHQWFGNLVTMRWWTDLWLNEGFASWMEYLAIDSLFPEWKLWTQFTVDEQQLAMKLDALEHTHPIEVPIKHPDEIRSIFDAISYQKGASIIHMLHDYLGSDDFRTGLQHYLKKHAYSNTDTIDLWQSLEDSSKKPVKNFMHEWTHDSGFPLLQVTHENDHLHITQQRFVSDPISIARKDTTVWPVPLLADNIKTATITKASQNIVLTDEAPLKINKGQTGFYRVNYSHDMQQKQLNALKNGKLSDIDRMGLLADSFEVTKAGYQSITEFLELLSEFSHEDSMATWDIIAGSIGAIRNTLSYDDEDNSLRDAMKPFIRELVSIELDRLGWSKKDGESHLDTLLRPTIISLSAVAENPDIIEKALSAYARVIHHGEAIDPDLRTTIFSTAARKGGLDVYEELLQRYNISSSSDEKLSITAAMTSFKQPEIHAKVLELLKTSTIRLQDISYWLAYSLMNRHSRMLSWTWMKSEWFWLKENLGSDLSFSRMPIYAARNFAEPQLLEDFKAFFADKMEPLLERSYNQGLEIAETATAWRERDAKLAHEWFDNRDNK